MGKNVNILSSKSDHPQTIAVCFHVLIPDDFKCKKSDQPVIILLEDRENMMYPLHVRE